MKKHTYFNSTRGASLVPAVACLLALVSTEGIAATWNVTETGQGVRNGTSGNAWSVSDFNTAGNWSANPGTSARISPADTVLVMGTITNEMAVHQNGLPGMPITIQFHESARLAARFNFGGKDYIHLRRFAFPDNVNIPTYMIVMGSNSGNISEHCLIDGGYSNGKTGSSIIHASYSRELTISSNRFCNMTGNGITGDTCIDHINVVNNEITSATSGTDATTDLVKLGWAANVTIQGNRFTLQASKIGGDPHNDIIQCWYNYADTTQRPRDWTIRNNWFEIRNATGGAFNNFTMFQYMAGDFLFSGNLFYSHSLSSQTGNGVNLSRHGDFPDAQLRVRFRNNTFVSTGNGLLNQITVSSQNGGAASNTLEVANNIFYSDAASGQSIRESVSTMPGGRLDMHRNIFFGWSSAVGHLNPLDGVLATSSDFGGAWEEGGRRLTQNEASRLFVAPDSAVFELADRSPARESGYGTGGDMELPSLLRRDAFPNPSVAKHSVWYIGAHMPVVTRPSPIRFTTSPGGVTP